MFRSSKYLGRRLAISVAIGLACCAVALAAKPPRPVTPAYTIMPFTVAPPAEFQSDASFVYDLNELGRAVGFERFRNSYEELCWGLHLNTTTGVCTRVPDARGASGINNLNQIVGHTASGGAFWRDPADALPVSLPPLLGDTGSAPYAINDAGMVVGNSFNRVGEVILTRGVVWRVVVEDGSGNVSVEGPRPLPLFAGDTEAWAIALSELSNGSFHVTGYSDEAIVWTVALDSDGEWTFKPGPAVSLVENNAYSSGHGINIDGDVCGGLGGYPMPFLAPAGQTAQLLPVPRDTHWGVANSINSFGKIVGILDIYRERGAVHPGPYIYHAYLWKDGSPIDLSRQIDPAAGWARLWTADVINDAGVIGGSGPRDVEWRGFVLIPNAP